MVPSYSLSLACMHHTHTVLESLSSAYLTSLTGGKFDLPFALCIVLRQACRLRCAMIALCYDCSVLFATAGQPLFAGQGELDHLDKIVKVLGTPTEAEWPGLRKLPNFSKIQLRNAPPQLRTKFTGARLWLRTNTERDVGACGVSR